MNPGLNCKARLMLQVDHALITSQSVVDHVLSVSASPEFYDFIAFRYFSAVLWYILRSTVSSQKAMGIHFMDGVNCLSTPTRCSSFGIIFASRHGMQEPRG